MKPIQLTLDERVLAEFDQTEEVRREGRSAVVRRLLVDYLARRRTDRVREAYERAYGSSPGVGDELPVWAEQSAWPE